MPHHADIVLLVTAVPLLARQSLLVQQAVSLCVVKQTALSVLLATCAPHQNKGLYAVHLAQQHLVRQENKPAVIVLLDQNVPTQSKCC